MGFLVKVLFLYCLYLFVRAMLRGRITIHTHYNAPRRGQAPRERAARPDRQERDGDIVDVDYRVISEE